MGSWSSTNSPACRERGNGDGSFGGDGGSGGPGPAAILGSSRRLLPPKPSPRGDLDLQGDLAPLRRTTGGESRPRVHARPAWGQALRSPGTAWWRWWKSAGAARMLGKLRVLSGETFTLIQPGHEGSAWLCSVLFPLLQRWLQPLRVSASPPAAGPWGGPFPPPGPVPQFPSALQGQGGSPGSDLAGTAWTNPVPVARLPPRIAAAAWVGDKTTMWLVFML